MSGKLSKNELEKRKAKKDRIVQVLSMPGWKDIENIMKEELMTCMDKCIEKDDPEARGAVKSLKKVSEEISETLDWGNSATDEYRKRFVTKTATVD